MAFGAWEHYDDLSNTRIDIGYIETNLHFSYYFIVENMANKAKFITIQTSWCFMDGAILEIKFSYVLYIYITIK